jgi:sugar phosphate isomerase/epimerase
MTGIGAMALHAMPGFVSANNLVTKPMLINKIPLGLGNHSLRAWRPNAIELINFAVEHKLDSVQFNNLKPFESLENKHLKKIKDLATQNDISIYVGLGGICEKSKTFNESWGDAQSLVKEGIRVAKALDSPILGVRIGVLEDRYYGGGIKPKIEEVIKLMTSFRGSVSDSGIKFAFENHAGDMRSEELLALINETGTDICGAFFDPGNAIYAMEDPKTAMEALGEHIICCSARDVVVWQRDDGAMFQWTAIGEGMMDYQDYANYMAENCPGVPIHLEIISNSPRSIPFLTDAYWKGWPELKAKDIVDFLKLARRGNSIELAQKPDGMDKKVFEMENQKDELLASLKYLREECGVGLKN